MNPLFDENPGDRPSKLVLGRYITGELDAAERAEVDAYLAAHPEARAHLDEIERARADVAPFSSSTIRSRAEAIRSDLGAPVPLPVPANRAWWVVLIAALLLVLALPTVVGPDPTPADPTDEPEVQFRGGTRLEIWTNGEDGAVPYAGRPLGVGDQLGLRVDGLHQRGVVVLSVDGTGKVTVFWPARGNDPEPLQGGGMASLPGSVVLDDAQGPEVFVAVFGTNVDEAVRGAEEAWNAGGAEGVSRWAELSEDVDAVEVTRR